MISAAVVTQTPRRTSAVGSGFQTRKPYRSVRLTQMKWNGTVSQLSQRSIATTFAAANATQATSIGLSRRNPVTHMTYGLDRRRAQLPAQPADADVHDVRAGIEVVSPHRLEELLAA